MEVQELPVKVKEEELPPLCLPAPKKEKKRARRLLSLLAVLCFATFALTMFFVGRSAIRALRTQGVAKTVYKIDAAVQAVQTPRFYAALYGRETPEKPEEFSFRIPRPYELPKTADAAPQAKNPPQNVSAVDLYAFDASAVPAGEHPILPVDLSVTDPTALTNTTAFAPDMAAILAAALHRPAETIPKEPLVLIVHTHATESYAEPGAISYDFVHTLTRTTDKTANVVAVGEELCRALTAAGIPTLHDETLHDATSYLNAYEYSAATVEEYLADYPSIRYVFDLHRDSMIARDYTKYRPVTLYEGTPCAQIMMLVGTSEKGAPDYPWQDNLTLAVALAEKLCKNAPGVPRATSLAGASYNQQLARYGLLLEVGSCGNSLDEAKVAVRAFAAAFADVLAGK